MTGTPRTDAYEDEYHENGTHVNEVFDFARQLESEGEAMTDKTKDDLVKRLRAPASPSETTAQWRLRHEAATALSQPAGGPEACVYPEECAQLRRCIRPGDHDAPPPCRGNPYQPAGEPVATIGDYSCSTSGNLISVSVGGSTHCRTTQEWHALSVAAFRPPSLPEGMVMVPREAWTLALDALREAEAILGGEYGDTYGVLSEKMAGLEILLAAAKGGKP